jgi:subfamily B ATP-binding cassette protein MsbA
MSEGTSQSNKAVKPRYFRRFLAYALDYKWLLSLAILAGITKFGVNYTFPWLVGSAVNTIAPKQDLTRENELQRQQLERVHTAPTLEQARAIAAEKIESPVAPLSERTHWLWVLVGLGAVFSVMHALGTYGRSYYAAKIGNRIIADVRQDLFDHLHRLSLHFYSRQRVGSIISRLITDIQTASQLINGGVVAVVMDLVSTVLGFAILLSISWQLTIACSLILPFYALTFKKLNPQVKQASLRVQSQLSKISGSVAERIAGIALIKTNAAEQREQKQFAEDTEEHYDRVLQQTNLSATVQGVSEFLVHLGQVIVIGLGGYYALGGKMAPGDVVHFMGTLAVMYLPVRRFAEINVVYQQSLAAIQRVFEVFDVTPAITEKPDAVKASPQLGRVEFRNVRFDYHAVSSENLPVHDDGGPASAVSEIVRLDKNIQPETAVGIGRRWTLDDVGFVVEPGQKIALVGPSGSGKTTLMSLLPRLYDVTEGAILVDGVDVRDYALRTLRRSIGIVQQDSFLFSGTIRDNIRYGRPKASDDEVIEAARAANAHGFITELAGGYDALLGERGVNLSGGQKQRISIARAILKDPKILILDEATSALDSESEAVVQEALARLMEHRTCFIIAHRLSTVRHVDRILVLQNGRVVESGRHDELLVREGLYARLVRQQFGLHAA